MLFFVHYSHKPVNFVQITQNIKFMLVQFIQNVGLNEQIAEKKCLFW